MQSTLGIMQSLAGYPSQFQGQTGASKLFFPDTRCLSQAGAATLPPASSESCLQQHRGDI